MPTSDAEPGRVAEIQGLYGPFVFPEFLLQRIWAEGAFDRVAAVTTDGRRVRVLDAGRWNRLGGPDFKQAKVQLGESAAVVGDVELHLHAEDWRAHGHAADRAYDGVVLHVVLFPPRVGGVTVGAGGREIPVLCLLPLLHHDLEEYAAEQAVERLASRSMARVTGELGRLAPEELGRLLAEHAERRWALKVHFAQRRLQRLGWEAACHHAALEILGYRFNRAPMLRAAGLWPLAAWRGGVKVEEIFAGERSAWRLQGSRPANHPRARLRQYAAWVAARPEWPGMLAALGADLPAVSVDGATGEVRRRHGFAALRRRLGLEICGGAVGGTRLDNLVCDGFLPLLAAHGAATVRGCWQHWFPGDLPPTLPRILRTLGVFAGRTVPVHHGAAQGLLGWMIEMEQRSGADAGRGA